MRDKRVMQLKEGSKLDMFTFTMHKNIMNPRMNSRRLKPIGWEIFGGPEAPGYSDSHEH